MALVELQQVYKEYRLGETCIAALQGIDLTIDAGEFVAVWGPSGSGKSTLCNVIGLLDYPTSGTVLWAGQDVNRSTDSQRSELRNTSIGFIFQSFNLLPVLSALENIMLPLQIRGASVTREQALQRLAAVGLENYAAHRPQKLSGGQQQRVAIARALITEPALVIADEPTANLDSETALKIIDLMRCLNQTSGTTFLFSTHDQRLLGRVNRRLLLRDGRLVEDTTQSPSSTPTERAVIDGTSWEPGSR
jgi:putative ABC transport system ATP-binding protein